MKRRTFLMGTGIVMLAGGWALRPQDKGASYDAYFDRLNRFLKREKVGRPTLLVDTLRLQQNTLQLMKHIHDVGRHYRIVAKSLPSLKLVQEVMRLTGTQRIMTFQQPFMNDLAEAEPDADLLLGKPMPVDAAERFFARLTGPFDPTRQVMWLIDTQARLDQYLALAQRLNKRLRISVEIDVGLHRGGLTDPAQLDGLLATLLANPAHLEFAGFMGYDGHVGKLPSFIETAATSHAKSNAEYRRYVEHLQQRWPAVAARTDLVFNGGGSPTVMMHGKDSPLTELSAGSCLLKPSDFDIPPLQPFVPAAFIATPVLKEWTGLKMPGPLPLGEIWQLWDVNRRRTYFIYGGYWKAKPVAPAGIAENSLYGYSSNQMMYNGSPATALKVDDYLFLQPTQSEAVLLQFGDLLAEKNGTVAGWWPPFPQQFDH